MVVVTLTAAPTLTVGLKDTSTTVGGSLTFTCQAQGQPIPQYSWYINAQPVAGSSSFLLICAIKQTYTVFHYDIAILSPIYATYIAHL